MNLVSHPEIHEHLTNRWKELDLTNADIIRDAEERGMLITPACISKYRNAIKRNKKGEIKSANFKGSLSLAQLIWVCTRYGVFVNINIGTLTIQEGKPVFKVLPYNESDALKRLKRIFPDTK